MADSSGWDLFFTSDDPIAHRDCLDWLRAINKELELLFRAKSAVFGKFLDESISDKARIEMRDEIFNRASSLISILARKDTAIACLTLRYSKPIESAAASATEVLEAIAQGKLEVLWQAEEVSGWTPLQLLRASSDDVLCPPPTRTIRMMDAIERLQEAVDGALAVVSKNGFVPAAPIAGKKSGRPPKWNGLLEVHDELTAKMTGVSQKDVVAEYNKRWANRGKKSPATVQILRTAIANRNRRNPRHARSSQ